MELSEWTWKDFIFIFICECEWTNCTSVAKMFKWQKTIYSGLTRTKKSNVDETDSVWHKWAAAEGDML